MFGKQKHLSWAALLCLVPWFRKEVVSFAGADAGTEEHQAYLVGLLCFESRESKNPEMRSCPSQVSEKSNTEKCMVQLMKAKQY